MRTRAKIKNIPVATKANNKIHRWGLFTNIVVFLLLPFETNIENFLFHKLRLRDETFKNTNRGRNWVRNLTVSFHFFFFFFTTMWVPVPVWPNTWLEFRETMHNLPLWHNHSNFELITSHNIVFNIKKTYIAWTILDLNQLTC